ncbi:MAG: hypothetical protein Q8P18_32085 [Pseudomonadota bacterium]|nr:hypothetical protein [Pseudomonadota bacterium]
MPPAQTLSPAPVQSSAPAQAVQGPASSGPGSSGTAGVGNQARLDRLRTSGGASPTAGGAGGASGGSAGGTGASHPGGSIGGSVCGDDDLTHTPMDRLRTAVICGDASTALVAFDAFLSPDMVRLGADTALLGQFVALEEDQLGPGILRRVAPAVDAWLDIANSALGTSPATEQEVLWDIGVRNPSGLVAFVAQLQALPAIGNAAVLGPILAQGDAADALVAFDDDATATALRGWFPGLSPFVVLPQLAQDSAGVLAAFRAAPVAQAWLGADLPGLSQQVPLWGAVGPWYTTLVALNRLDILPALILLNPAGWGPGLRDLLVVTGPPTVSAPVEGSALGFTVLSAIGAVDKGAAGRLVGIWGWSLALSLPFALAGGWLDVAAATAMVNGPGSTVETQALAAVNPFVITLVRTTGADPFALFPLLVLDSARLAQAAEANPLLMAWLAVDPIKLKQRIEQGAQWQAWAGALVRGAQTPLLLKFAKDHGADWRAGVDGAAVFQAVLDSLPARMPDEESFRGFFNLWGDGTGRTGAQAVTAFTHLAAARIMPAGEETIFDDEFGIVDPNAPAGSTNTYDLRAVWMPVSATDDGMLEMMKMLAPMSLNEVATTRTLGFVPAKVWRWKQTAPVASTDWHAFTPRGAGNRDLGTSYAWSGNVIMYAPKALNGVANPGRMDTTASDSDSLGVAGMVGGGQQVGRQDNRTLGAESLTYFQNHARHEFGHSVGDSQYAGMQMGNDAVVTYAGWAAVTDLEFQGAMWSASGSVRMQVGSPPTRVSVPTADIAAWVVSLLKTGAEPGTGNVLIDDAAFAGVAMADKLALIRSSRVGRQAMVRYLDAVLGGSTDPSGVPENAYKFTGFNPPGQDVYLYSSRYQDSFAKYSKAAYTALHRSHGWYCLSSPAEMFAEIYTKRYSGGTKARALNGVDWDAWFNTLEAAGPSTTPTGPGAQASDPLAGAPTAPGATEVAPSADIIDSV